MSFSLLKIGLPLLAFIMATQSQASSQCLSDNFSQNSDWQILPSSDYQPEVKTIQDERRLRLTQAEHHQANGVVFKSPISSSQDLKIEFTAYAYGGSWGASARQGDGINIVLSDASVEPALGAYGGSLGYAPMVIGNVYKPGFAGGWIGVGLDGSA